MLNEFDELDDIFNVVAEARKNRESEIKALVSDSFDSLFWSPLLKEEKKPKKTKRKKVIKENIEPKQENVLIEKSLGLLSEPSNKKQQNDPLTPLDQKFVTFDELQKHYNLFLTRIQQQLSTVGGGGETNLAFMNVPVKTITSNSYNITYRDYYIGVNYAGAVTITLPHPDREGRKYVIKDELGECSKGTNRYITIVPQSDNLIDNRDRAILAYDYGSLTFIWKSNSWRII
jgi:hypothetical protein